MVHLTVSWVTSESGNETIDIISPIRTSQTLMTLDLNVYTDMWWEFPCFENRGSPVLLNIPGRFKFTPWRMFNARPAEGAVRNTFFDDGFALEVPHDV
jgi:hypothetical protein